jgi:AcrR family transcriptional regulator
MSEDKTVRAPVQSRAIARREALLDATARLLDRGGYDALTTNAVAVEAGASIGTVYQYFTSKERLLEALLERHRARLEAAIDGALGEGGGDLMTTADLAVDAFAGVWRSEPGYRAAWAATQAQSLIERAGGAWSASFSERIAVALRASSPGLARGEARAIAITVVHLVSGLVYSAMSHGRTQERALLQEARRALRAYLAERLGASGGALAKGSS